VRRLWLLIAGSFAATFLAGSAMFWLLVEPSRLAGSTTRAVVRAQALYVLFIWLLFAAVAWAMTRAAARPLQRLRDELDRLDPGNALHRLGKQPQAAELDPLVDGINDLISRVHLALGQLDRFAAQVAHELRLPLTLARLRLEQASSQLPETVAEELAGELERLGRFVDQTLLLSRAEQGSLPLKRRPVDLHELVAQIAEGIALLAETEDRGLALDSEPAWIDFDAEYSKQIVYNLLANALRHGSGQIRVRLRCNRGAVRLLVVNQLRSVPRRRGALGTGQRIVAALAALHRGMSVRYRSGARAYVARLVAVASAAPPVPALRS